MNCGIVRALLQKKRADLWCNTKPTLNPQPCSERMKIMSSHSSATVRETPHVNQLSRTNTIVNALKRRAQAVLNDRSVDPQSRAIIRYALETNDPWLARLVRSAGAGEDLIDAIESEPSEEPGDEDTNAEKIEALAEMICRAGEESAAALFVLMGTLQNSPEPEALANTAKHLAFTRCGEFNLYGMVDAHITVVEEELLATNTLIS